MGIYRLLKVTALCLPLLLLASCAKPQYWISGLTLPPGATVVQRIESAHSSQQMPPLPFVGKIKKSLDVSFNDPNGWDAVAAHVDGCMRTAGYTEGMQSLSQMAGSMPSGQVPDIGSMMRMYTKQGSKYMVTLTNLGGVGKQAGQQMPDMSAMGVGSYMLMVAEMEQ